jgi:polysaccharide pyruvyl transferase CsaB
MKRVVLCGYYGMGNGGDEALLATLLQMLPAGLVPIVLSKTPEATAQRYGVETVDRWNVVAVWQALRRADAFVWGGGSLVQDVSSKISPWYYLGWMKLAQMMGLKTIAWAQGIGPIRQRFNQAFTQNVLGHCTAVSVRDRGSSDLLTHWGIAHTLAPDPVWAMAAAPAVRPPNSHLPANPPPLNPPPLNLQPLNLQPLNLQPTVAVNLRQHATLTPERLAVLTQALIQFQQQTQAKILLVPFQASLDLALAETLQQHLRESSQVVMLDDPEALRLVFEQVDVAIVMRLHALIMAAAAGCRCLALSYDPKVMQVATSLHLPVWEMTQLSDDVDYWVKTWVGLLDGKCLSTEERHHLSQNAHQHQQLLRQLV